MRILLIILLGMVLCLSACSDKFKPHYRVVQMEDGAYRVQSAYICLSGKTYWDNYSFSGPMSRAAACARRDILIQVQLKEYYEKIEVQKNQTIKRVVDCDWKTS